MDQEKRAIENAMARYQPAPRPGLFSSYGQAARFLLFWALVPWVLFILAAAVIIRW